MPLATSGSLSWSNLQTEFGGSGSTPLGAFRRGGGLVANHAANTNIPTSNTNIIMPNNFWGAEKNFSTTCTIAGSGNSGFGTETVVAGSFSQTQVGKSFSSTASATLQYLYDLYDTKGFPTYLATYLGFSGNHTGTWWSSINGVPRSGSGSFDGTFTEFVSSGGPAFPSKSPLDTASDPATIEIILS
jgi:hypothetical protein